MPASLLPEKLLKSPVLLSRSRRSFGSGMLGCTRRSFACGSGGQLLKAVILSATKDLLAYPRSRPGKQILRCAQVDRSRSILTCLNRLRARGAGSRAGEMRGQLVRQPHAVVLAPVLGIDLEHI